MTDVQLLVKTLLRPDCLERLLASIRTYYPTLPVSVLDDSPWADVQQRNQQHCAAHGAEYLESEPDIGLSAGRNRLVRQAHQPLVVLLEDDFVFTEQTDLARLRQTLLEGDYDVVGGALETNGSRAHFEGFLDLTDGVLTYTPLEDYTRSQPCHIVFNFLMAQRCRLPLWDERLKVAEHTPWALAGQYLPPGEGRPQAVRRPDPVRLAYEPGCALAHHKQRPVEYKQFRCRVEPYVRLAQEIWGIRHTQGSLQPPHG